METRENADFYVKTIKEKIDLITDLILIKNIYLVIEIELKKEAWEFVLCFFYNDINYVFYSYEFFRC